MPAGLRELRVQHLHEGKIASSSWIGQPNRWAAAVKIVQCVLPTDPDCPGITALTRPVGSVNGKNGAAVRVLKTMSPGIFSRLRDEGEGTEVESLETDPLADEDFGEPVGPGELQGFDGLDEVAGEREIV